jgi:hypothetical protein
MDEVKLQRTTIPIGALVDSVDRQQIRLPEIQRDYVWKPAQIAALLDSLYREYPSGSILLWQTDESIEERSPKFEPTGAPPLTASVQYLLDGQQRLTSLHRVFHEPEKAKVVFSVESERFQIESAATVRDPRWVLVHSILREADLFGYVDQLAEKILGSTARRSASAFRVYRESPGTCTTSRSSRTSRTRRSWRSSSGSTPRAGR